MKKTRLLKELKKARKALKPFADFGKALSINENMPETTPVMSTTPNGNIFETTLTAGAYVQAKKCRERISKLLK